MKLFYFLGQESYDHCCVQEWLFLSGSSFESRWKSRARRNGKCHKDTSRFRTIFINFLVKLIFIWTLFKSIG